MWWGRRERGVIRLTQRTLLVERRLSQIQIRMAACQLFLVEGQPAEYTLSRMLDIYISANFFKLDDELTLYSKF